MDHEKPKDIKQLFLWLRKDFVDLYAIVRDRKRKKKEGKK